MTKPSDTFRKLSHPLGVVGPARVRAFTGSGLPKTTQGTRAPARALVLLCALVGVLACSAAPASAEATHKFEKAITETEPFVAFAQPWGLSLDSSGNLYVADATGEAIDIFNPSGAFQAKLDNGTVLNPEPPFTKPPFTGPNVRSVAVGGTGDVFVGESQCDCVQVLAPKVPGAPKEGYQHVAEWTGEKTKATSFGAQFVYVAVNNSPGAHSGDVYVLNTVPAQQKLYVIEPGPLGEETKPLQEITLPDGHGGGQAVHSEDGLTVSPITGDVYVANPGTGTVEVINVEGKPEPELEPLAPAGGFTPIDVAIDPTTGEVYVVDGVHHVVDEFSSRGTYGGQIKETTSGPLVEPLGVAVSSSGQVYVSDGAAKTVDVYGAEPPSPPAVEGESVTKVTDDSATLNAEILPGSESVKYRFEYGVCATPGSCVPGSFEHTLPVPDGLLAAGFQAEAVSAPISGLIAGRTYHFRVVVENLLGVAHAAPPGEATFSTRAVGYFGLPDGRAWEMVSPSEKEGALIKPIQGEFGGDDIQAAASGDAITYLTDEPTESAPQGYSNLVQVLSTRGADGWSSSDLAAPYTEATGVSGKEGQEYRFFSEDLSRAILQPLGAFIPAGSSQALAPAEASEQTAFLRTDYLNANPAEPCVSGAGADCYTPLVTGAAGFANVPAGTQFGDYVGTTDKCEHDGYITCGPEFRGATPDLHHVVLRSGAALTPGGGVGEAFEDLYEWNAGEPPASQLQPVSLLPPNKGLERNKLTV